LTHPGNREACSSSKSPVPMICVGSIRPCVTMFAAQFLDPPGQPRGLLFVEKPGADDLRRVDPPVRDADQPGVGVEAAEDAFQLRDLGFRGQVALVDHDDVGELDLINQQIDDGAFIRVAHAHLPIAQVFFAETSESRRHCLNRQDAEAAKASSIAKARNREKR